MNSIQLTNDMSFILPATGGVGTTIFYIVGGVLVIAAVVVLIPRFRAKDLKLEFQITVNHDNILPTDKLPGVYLLSDVAAIMLSKYLPYFRTHYEAFTKYERWPM